MGEFDGKFIGVFEDVGSTVSSWVCSRVGDHGCEIKSDFRRWG